MREKKIQYGGVDKSGETIAVKFSDPVQREKASSRDRRFQTKTR